MGKYKNRLIIIFGSTICPEDEEKIIKDYFKKKPSLSNSEYEKKLLKGFETTLNKNENLFFISAPAVGNWPFSSKTLFVKNFKSSEHLKTIKYCDVVGINHISKSHNLLRKALKIIKECKANNDSTLIHVICCEAHYPYLWAAAQIKKKFKNSFLTLIAPDLPEHMLRSKNSIYTKFKKQNINKINRAIKFYVDSFVCLTNRINEKINTNNKPYIISEGVLDETSITNSAWKNSGKVISCVFVGKVDARNGIEIILEAAKIAPSNLKFLIYGSGDADEIVKKYKGDNLKFFGFIPPTKLDTILKEADVLMSPRLTTCGDYIYYSFPSKIFDFLRFSKPIISFKLPCYFEELNDFVYYPKEETPKSFLDSILFSLENFRNDLEKRRKILKKYSCQTLAKNIKELYK